MEWAGPDLGCSPGPLPHLGLLTLGHAGSGDCILGGKKGRTQWASVFGVNPHSWVNSPPVPPDQFLCDAWAPVGLSGPCDPARPISPLPLPTTQAYLSSSSNN